MKSKGLWILVILFVVLAGFYLFGSFFFSEQLINRPTQTLATSLQMLPLTPEVAFVLADSPYKSLEAIVAHQAVEQFGEWVSLFVPGAFFVSELRADFDKDEV